MQIESDTVIEPDAFIIDRVAADEAETERNDLAVLSPNEKPRTVWHPLSNGAEIIFGQRLKFQWRSLVDGQIQRIDFLDQRCDVVHHLHFDLWCALRFTKLSAQIFAGRLTKCAEIFVPVCIWKRQLRHRHTRNPRVSIRDQRFEGRAIVRREILKDDKGSFVSTGVGPKSRQQRVCHPWIVYFLARSQVARASSTAN